jgi:hypothetical protein
MSFAAGCANEPLDFHELLAAPAYQDYFGAGLRVR